MSLEEIKEKIDWRTRAFEYKNKNSYDIENEYDMTCIHINEVKNIDEWNLPHDIINPPKRAKFLNIYYSPILHGCMNTRRDKVKF